MSDLPHQQLTTVLLFLQLVLHFHSLCSSCCLCGSFFRYFDKLFRPPNVLFFLYSFKRMSHAFQFSYHASLYVEVPGFIVRHIFIVFMTNADDKNWVFHVLNSPLYFSVFQKHHNVLYYVETKLEWWHFCISLSVSPWHKSWLLFCGHGILFIN